jgi:hypothetical protein
MAEQASRSKTVIGRLGTVMAGLPVLEEVPIHEMLTTICKIDRINGSAVMMITQNMAFSSPMGCAIVPGRGANWGADP